MLDTTTRMLLRLEHARRREKPPMPSPPSSSAEGESAAFLKSLRGLRGLDLLEQHRCLGPALAAMHSRGLGTNSRPWQIETCHVDHEKFGGFVSLRVLLSE